MKVIKSFVAVLAMIDFVASFGNGANEDHSRRRLNSLKTPKLGRVTIRKRARVTIRKRARQFHSDK